MTEEIKELIINSDSIEKIAPEILRFMYLEMILNTIIISLFLIVLMMLVYGIFKMMRDY